MANSGTFSGYVVPSNISCGSNSSANHTIRGSWQRHATSTTFTASLYKSNGGAGFQYSCSRGLCLKVIGDDGQVHGQACFQTGSCNGSTFTFGNGARINVYSGSASCCAYGGGCPAVATTMNGMSQQNTVNMTVYISGNFTLQVCWDGWCGSNSSRGCKNIEYGGSGYIDPYVRTPTGPISWVDNISCNSALAHVSVGNKGIPEHTFKQRFEYATNPSFSGQITTPYVSSINGQWNLSGLNPATQYWFRSYAFVETGGQYYPVNSVIGTFKTKGAISRDGISYWATNPSPFRVKFDISGINWNPGSCNNTKTKAILNWKYKMDGVNYSFTKVFENNATEYSYDTGVDLNRIPDDETITYTWTLQNSFSSEVFTKTIYCQKSYDVFIIGPENNYKPIEAEMKVSPYPGQKPIKDIRRITSL